MSRMQTIAVARGLQRQATDLPLARVPDIALEHFARVDNALAWGLTLNK